MPVDVTMFDEDASRLIRFYEQAEARLSRLMLQAATTAYSYRRLQLLLEQLDSIVRALEEGQRGWSRRYLPRAYRTGLGLTADALRTKKLPAFSLIDRRGIEVAIARTEAATAQALQSIAPFASKVWTDTSQRIVSEKAIAQLIAEGRVEGLGPRELGKRIAQTLKDGASERLKGVVDDELRARLELTARGDYVRIFCRDGKFRNYNLKKYGEMVAQSATRMAATEGAIAASVAAGSDLVQISVHSGACPTLCLPVQGKVYSLTGATKGFPVLTDFARPPLHPNCRHVLMGADEDFMRERGIFERSQAFSSSEQTADSMPEYWAMLRGGAPA